MTFKEIYEKYNLTEQEIHSLKVMKDRGLSKSFIEANIDFDKWNKMIEDEILIGQSRNSFGVVFCYVSPHKNIHD